jgi:hypothetical protein
MVDGLSKETLSIDEGTLSRKNFLNVKYARRFLSFFNSLVFFSLENCINMK